jgi:hypothetical protein
VELLLVGCKASAISKVVIAAYECGTWGGGSSGKVVGTNDEAVLKKHHLRAVAMWVGWSKRPVSVVSTGMSLCLWPKCHFTAIQRCSGVAPCKNSFAQLHLAKATTLCKALFVALQVSGSWVLGLKLPLSYTCYSTRLLLLESNLSEL